MYRGVILLLAITVATAFTGSSSLPAADDKPEAVKQIVLFNGKDLTGWKFRGPESRSKWVVGIAHLDEKNSSRLVVTQPDKAEPGELQLINTSASLDIYTEQKFGDGTFELEVMVPKGSNSGAYVMGQYEVQIFDSFGQKNLGYVDMGGIYGVAAPKVNAAKKPGEWQKFVIEYQAPRFEDNKKTGNVRFVKITLNDQVIHENFEVNGPTGGSLNSRDVPMGPLMLQGDHGPIAFRSLKFIPKAAKAEAKP